MSATRGDDSGPTGASRSRRSIRLPYYDYGQGGTYFITICTHERRPVFTERRVAAVVERAWWDIPVHHKGLELEGFVVMPSHVHGVLILRPYGERAQQAAPLPSKRRAVSAGSLGAVVRSFKSRVTRDVHELTGTSAPVWQRNYHEHVVRTEAALRRIQQYIHDNPARWAHDLENPHANVDAREASFGSWLREQARRPLGPGG